jgi:hypothetical protein
MWDPRHLTIHRPPRPVPGIVLVLVLLTMYSHVHNRNGIRGTHVAHGIVTQRINEHKNAANYEPSCKSYINAFCKLLFARYYLLGYNALYSVGSQATYRRNISSPPSDPALKMEATCSCETSGDFQWTTPYYHYTTLCLLCLAESSYLIPRFRFPESNSKWKGWQTAEHFISRLNFLWQPVQ